MSYEGFEQWLCEDGHYFVYHVYFTPDPDKWRCNICGKPLAWSNIVDQTNNGYASDGSYDDIGYVKMTALPHDGTTRVCPVCDGTGQAPTEPRYEIPGPDALRKGHDYDTPTDPEAD